MTITLKGSGATSIYGFASASEAVQATLRRLLTGDGEACGAMASGAMASSAMASGGGSSSLGAAAAAPAAAGSAEGGRSDGSAHGSASEADDTLSGARERLVQGMLDVVWSSECGGVPYDYSPHCRFAILNDMTAGERPLCHPQRHDSR